MERQKQKVSVAINAQEDVGGLLYLINQIRSDPKLKGWSIMVDIIVEEPEPAIYKKRSRGYYH